MKLIGQFFDLPSGNIAKPTEERDPGLFDGVYEDKRTIKAILVSDGSTLEIRRDWFDKYATPIINREWFGA